MNVTFRGLPTTREEADAINRNTVFAFGWQLPSVFDEDEDKG